ncbi:ADP-dependent (S)-NAD(P)H-hydrate dehydratase [Actinoplanes philippinensis]|uniref:ADP-dependent (S)-NAD(P)H-hydrate dehydratase n=1 Tax=Actinoplanes philippinensis TaxID=35752 RepID=A0A1I2M139_9ACTN|nr:NAD(P)H-hydrate dehydratase [Actinoplanes philippinensis]GIE82900.1 ADP-dependent (S)-NAD(P)H-hydrate dehydratase [Actinoplanes philippinensis]SFF84560.1 yjeF C-terminal region, hydroxyethylthiazole kinase-related [Actinoplanes philippinensis]
MPNRSEERVVTPGLLRDWPLPSPTGDKTSRGTVLVIGGARCTPGAVLLAGVAAMRAGAGRLQLAVAEESAVPLSISVPEAKVVGLTPDGAPSDEVLEMSAAADVIALGPGLDDVDRTTRLMTAVLGAAGRDTAVVLDAYALGALSKDAGLLRQSRAVLTPNLVEAGHLLGRDPGDDLAGAAHELAVRHDAVVSVHGHIAAPDGSAWREESGDAGLGTSGSGDVRAGIVAGLLARGAEPAQAACWAAFAHAVSGQRLAPRFGRVGFLARELVDQVASTIASV